MLKQFASLTALSIALCATSVWADPAEEVVSAEFSLNVTKVDHDPEFRTEQDPELAPHGVVRIFAMACYQGDEPRTDPFYRMTSINTRQGLAGMLELDMYLDGEYVLLPNELGSPGGVGSEGPFGPSIPMNVNVRQQRGPVGNGPSLLWEPGDCYPVEFMAFLQRSLRRLTFRMDVMDLLDSAGPSQEVAVCLDLANRLFLGGNPPITNEEIDFYFGNCFSPSPILLEIQEFCGANPSTPGCNVPWYSSQPQ